MARDRDPFGQALVQLRGDLRDGRLRPGDPLVATALAERLRISPTPIREALSRLAGEGLVEDRRGRGFFAPKPGAAEIEEFYALHAAQVSLAIDLGAWTAAPSDLKGPVFERMDLRARTEAFWAWVIHRADAGVVMRAHARLSDQLGLIRLLEPLVLTDIEEELKVLTRLAATAADEGLQEASMVYHARRRAVARQLESRLRDSLLTEK